MADTTPMMQQYYEVKREHPDAILFFRMGDFFEMFGRDAEVAAKLLDIALTTRDKNRPDPVPMCGVPHHAADAYVERLIKAGRKVVICEQVEDPRKAKGLVKRAVVRVVTPGTYASAEAGARVSTYLAAVVPAKSAVGFGAVDVTTGEFFASDFVGADVLARCREECAKLAPKEVLLPRRASTGTEAEKLLDGISATVTPYEDWAFDYHLAFRLLTEHFGTASLDGYGMEGHPLAVAAAGALLQYLQDTQGGALQHLTKLSLYNPGEFLMLNGSALRHLELLEPATPGAKEGSLLWVLDETVSALGARLLCKWVTHPLVDVEEIERRQDVVEELKEHSTRRAAIRVHLAKILDLDRLLSRVALGLADARDLLALKRSLDVFPELGSEVERCEAPWLRACHQAWDTISDVAALLEEAIAEAPPALKHELGVIKDGYDARLDSLRRLCREGKTWLTNLEAAERARTGIGPLKVRYNKVFGYYIEVTKRHLGQVPADYLRKQTLVNAERFVTEELKEHEEKILGAEEEMLELEQQIFADVVGRVAREIPRMQRMARVVAELDVLASLAEVADLYGYVRPTVNRGSAIRISEGRHPVLERLMDGEPFVPNDAFLDATSQQVLIITGPNMAGKSTYMRQVALIVLLAQMGSFVPVAAAEVGVVDRIFTRVGASDNLVRGLSTFMVEMNETANILNNATPRSLILFDEIGRGTSTYDGVSIAWSVVEYIHEHPALGAKTLFATHYHELTQLAERLQRVHNLTMRVEESHGEVVFLRKVVEGSADRSYGIQVAKLAGLPEALLSRSRQILDMLEHEEPGRRSLATRQPKAEVDLGQLSLFAAGEAVRRELTGLDLDHMTPMQALAVLVELQRKAQKDV